jgi:quinol monooxygenase YgiN
MIIVSGVIHVDPDARDEHLAGCRAVIEQARDAPGCLDFHLSADPIDPSRINVYEQWESQADVEAFRVAGGGDDEGAAIVSAAVVQHEVASSQPL